MLARTRLMLLAVAALVVFPSAAGGELNPIDVSPTGSSGSAPRLASDGSGTVVAVWREVNGDQSFIRAAVRLPGGSWTTAQRISGAFAAAESPEVAMDRLGNAVAVWHRSSGQDSVVQAAIRPAGGAWSAPQNLSAPGEAAFNPDVALEAGRMTAAWNVMRERRSVVQSSARTVAGPWEPLAIVSGPVGNAYGPSVAMDDRGGAVATWQWSNGAFLVVQAASRSADGVWSVPESISGPGRSAARPQAAMDAAGNAVVGWLRFNGSWIAAQVASRPAGRSWEAPQNLSDRGGTAGGLDLTMNRRGDAAVSWAQRELATAADLWTSFRVAGSKRWGRVPVTGRWEGLQARIALDDLGNATVAWAGAMTVSASFKPIGQPWQEDYLLSGYEDPTAQVAVTAQAPRNATALWVRAGETDDRIQTVSYDVNTAEEEAEEEEEEEDEDEEEEEIEEESIEGKVFTGSPKADQLVGTPGNDVFYGHGGNDTIDGRGGRDVVYGGAGIDRIMGGRGADKLFGGAGSDRILGGRGRDALTGGAGSDFLRGGSGSDVLYGSRGHDVIDGRAGKDLVYAGIGDDRVVGGPGSDRLFGGGGDDGIAGGPGSDMLMGGYGRDVLSGDAGNDTLRALDRGADVALGGRGLDLYSLDRWLDRARSIESRL
jgi:RTX calcium-binding nonapeptide repeat (4 copies)